MSLTTLARTEARIARRSRSFLAVLGALVAGQLVIVSLMSMEVSSNAYIHHYREMNETTIVVSNLASPSWFVTSLTWLVPLLGLLVGSGAIVDDRRTGRVRTTLSMPCSRRELLAGKLLGRLLAFSLAIVVTLCISAIAVYARFGLILDASYLRFVLVTMLYGWLFTALGVCLSTLFATKRRTVVATIATYIVLNPLGWGLFLSNVPYLPRALEPTTAYAVLVANVFPDLEATARVVIARGASASSASFRSWSSISEDVPFVLTAWGSSLIVVGWMLVAVTLANYVFNRTDLNA